MLRISSIFNSKSVPAAFLLAVLIICCVEIFGSNHFPKKYFSHEVDRLLYDLDSKTFSGDYILLGDSVGLQLFRQYKADKRFVLLTSNQAIETTGQYFLVRRYIKKNKAPKGVIFASRPFQDFNLTQSLTENFVLRPFNHLDEILDIFKAKRNATMAVKMMTYRFFPSFKYRLQLQKAMTGFTNSNIYSGLDGKPRKGGMGQFSLIRIIRNAVSPGKTAPRHFKALAALLQKKGIRFFYIPVPIEEHSKPYLMGQYRELLSKHLPDIKRNNQGFYFFDDLIEYPKDRFVDHVHFNAQGLGRANNFINEKVNSALKIVEGDSL